MNLEKSRLKLAITEGIGRDLEKSVEEAEIEVYRFQGACSALEQVKKLIGAKSVELKDEFLADKIVLDKDDPMAIAKFVVARFQGLVAEVHSLSENAHANGVSIQGKANGIRAALEHVKKLFDTEVNRLKAIEEQLKSGEIVVEDGDMVQAGTGPRLPGVHPGLSLKTVRMEEDRATQPEEPPPPPPEDENIAQPEKPVKTRAKRRKV
jgi:hypothetical protein